MLLKDKNVIITGCNRGIGHAILETCAENGANVWACVRKPSPEFESEIQRLMDRYGVEIYPIYFELQNADQIKAAVKTIMSMKRPVDALINNAGITYNALFQMSTMDNIKEVFDINLFSQITFTQYIVKLMVRKNKGSIVNIASTAAIDGNSGRAIYGASKASIVCITKAMASELGENGIRVNAIAPGITQTDMLSSMTDEVIQKTVNQTDLKRAGEPFDIAKACLFLASDLSSYITGQVLRVDGGLR